MIVPNIRQNRYRTSGRRFSSYYPFHCDQCGSSLNSAAVKRHTTEDCATAQKCVFTSKYGLRCIAENKTVTALEQAVKNVTRRR